MNRRILSLVTVLFFFGMVTGAQAWIKGIDPKNADGQGAIKTTVYNNAKKALTEGEVVVWDIADSTGDNDMYVTVTTTADSGLVAGVVTADGCAEASNCPIIVYGIAQCDVASSIGEGGLICTSTTTDVGKPCASASGAGAYAVAGTATTGADQIECFVHVR